MFQQKRIAMVRKVESLVLALFGLLWATNLGGCVTEPAVKYGCPPTSCSADDTITVKYGGPEPVDTPVAKYGSPAPVDTMIARYGIPMPVDTITVKYGVPQTGPST